MLAIGVLLVAFIYAGSARAQASCTQGSSVYVVAHEDDSILFTNPALQQDINSGRCVETIFVTAGDDGQGSAYWMGREAGAEAAYAQMAGVANTWTQADAGVSGHPMPRLTLSGMTTVSLVFMRLPDGNVNGSGFASTGFESLQKLWQGTVSSIGAIDGSSSYTTSDLTDTLTSLIETADADQVVTQDFIGTYGDGDHSDHHATAYFTEAAGQADPTPHTLTGYIDYPISSLPANLSASDTQAKQATWFAYAPHDSAACQTVSTCQANGYASYWSREYVSAASATNVAPLATVTASSQNTSTGQLATKAVDGSSLGYPTDYTHEWATVGQGAGAWLNLAWSSPQTLSSITVYDRPNLNDQVTGGTITFSDGSSVSVGVLPNDGSPLTLSFAAKTVTSLRFTITAVSSTTQNIGLAEIQAYTGGSAPAPAVSGLSPTSGPVGTAAVINASGFIATHALSVTVGGVTAPITSGGTTDASGAATVHFTIPSVAAGTQAVVVSDGTSSATSPTGFSVSAVSPPAVSGLSPTSGPVGTAAVINASGFIATHALSVTVGGTPAPITSGGTTDASGNATVHFTIPSVATGTQAVVVSDGTNSATSPTGFSVSRLTTAVRA